MSVMSEIVIVLFILSFAIVGLIALFIIVVRDLYNQLEALEKEMDILWRGAHRK